MGELMRRRCDSVDAYVSLFSTCIYAHIFVKATFPGNIDNTLRMLHMKRA
jgi:hypothetical protein